MHAVGRRRTRTRRAGRGGDRLGRTARRGRTGGPADVNGSGDGLAVCRADGRRHAGRPVRRHRPSQPSGRLRARATARTSNPAEPPYEPGTRPPLRLQSGSAKVMATDPSTPLTITPIFWTGRSGSYSFATSYTNLIQQYIGDVAADSGSRSNVFASLTQYYLKSAAGPAAHPVRRAGARDHDRQALRRARLAATHLRGQQRTDLPQRSGRLHHVRRRRRHRPRGAAGAAAPALERRPRRRLRDLPAQARRGLLLPPRPGRPAVLGEQREVLGVLCLSQLCPGRATGDLRDPAVPGLPVTDRVELLGGVPGAGGRVPEPHAGRRRRAQRLQPRGLRSRSPIPGSPHGSRATGTRTAICARTCTARSTARPGRCGTRP